MDSDFETNTIYRYLKTRENATNLVSMINTTYNHCEKILGQIPKEFSNYTLHDIHHAIRVINYMTKFVESNISEFSDLHLALILLVGLMHDTGMFVSDEEKKEIISYIKTSGDTETQIKNKLQDYVRERHSQRVRKILDNYFIDNNNSCSFSCIFQLGSYNFSDDISCICQSHTESIEWTKNNLRKINIIGEYKYNPQHIAFLLKLGDNLDIDDRRAPLSLLRLLKIRGYSESEWLKHVPITNYEKIEFRDNQYHIFFLGECSDSNIYRKVIGHITWLKDTCIEINAATNNFDAPYNFVLAETISTDNIVTHGFEPVELSFSLDYESVLKLLMGEKIYGEKKFGLRELIQNSIDAVMVMKEQISKNPVSYYKPSIWIEINKEKNMISVCDNGIGMNSDVLNKFFFNIGKSYYASSEYKDLHLKYDAIGHFGIGFLACFMLSSNIKLETQAIGKEPIVMEFERLSQFITKMKTDKCTFDEGHGTRIHLSYEEVIPQVFGSEEDLIGYVKETFLTDGYDIMIIDSNLRKTTINNSAIIGSDIRHINTERYDIAYSVKEFPHLWEYIDDVWKRKVPLYFPYYLSDYCYYVDAGRLFDLLDQLEEGWILDELQENTIHILEDLYCDSAEAEILSKIINYNDEQTLDERLGNYILSQGYYDGYMYDVVVPCFTDAKYTEMYLDAALSNNRKEMEVLENIHSEYIVMGNNVPSNKELAEMANNVIDANDVPAEYLDEGGYYYPFKPQQRRFKVIKANNKNLYLPIENNHKVENGKFYMHGIAVADELNVVFPVNIFGAEFDMLRVNVKSNEFELNVSRNEFNKDSRTRLYREIAKEIYKDIAQNKDYIYKDEERQLIMKFVDEIE